MAYCGGSLQFGLQRISLEFHWNHRHFQKITRKIAALRAAFSIFYCELQPSAALLGPFKPNDGTLQTQPKMFKIHLDFFAEINLKIFAEIFLNFFAEICLNVFAKKFREIFVGKFFGEFFSG